MWDGLNGMDLQVGVRYGASWVLMIIIGAVSQLYRLELQFVHGSSDVGAGNCNLLENGFLNHLCDLNAFSMRASITICALEISKLAKREMGSSQMCLEMKAK